MAFDGKQIRNATIVGAKLANLTITDAQLAADAVTTAKILNAAVDATKLAANAVIEAKLADSAVTTGKLADASVTTVKLADSAIDATKLADGSVTLAKLAADSVDSSKIVDGSITGTDIATNTVAKANLVTAYEGTLLYRDGTRALSGALDLGSSNKIINLGNPTQAQDAATKAYVDSVVSALDLKSSVRVATTENIALSDTTTAVDGVTLATNDRVLAKNQTNASENGIWVVSASGAWARSEDANANSNVTTGLFTFVEDGTTNGSTGWVLTTSGAITVGTTNLSFTQFSGAGSYLPGFGLTLSGNQFAVDFNDADGAVESVGDTNTAGVSNKVARADHSHALEDGAITSAKIADGSVTEAKLATAYEENLFYADGSRALSGDVDAGGGKITNLDDPENAQDAATKAYVDSSALVFNDTDNLGYDEEVWDDAIEDATLPGKAGVSDLVARADHSHSLNENAIDGILDQANGRFLRRDGSNVNSSIDMGYRAEVADPFTPEEPGYSIVNLATPVEARDAATKAYVDSQIITAGGGAEIANKGMAAEVTTADGDLACGERMAFNAKGYVQVFVNGIKVNVTGDLNGDCYFSADGTTPRPLNGVRANDELFWNGTIAQYELAVTDTIDFDYTTSLEMA